MFALTSISQVDTGYHTTADKFTVVAIVLCKLEQWLNYYCTGWACCETIMVGELTVSLDSSVCLKVSLDSLVYLKVVVVQ
jgi:hypothetical protein